MKIRTLTRDDLKIGLFEGFNRHQNVEKCWRKVDNQWVLKEIQFIEDWDKANYLSLLNDFSQTFDSGGIVWGAFIQNSLVGFASLESTFFGPENEYLQLSSIHITSELRGHGIGRKLFDHAAIEAKRRGAVKIYVSAHSSQESIAFYHKLGCVEALYYHAKLVEMEPCDCQLEYIL